MKSLMLWCMTLNLVLMLISPYYKLHIAAFIMCAISYLCNLSGNHEYNESGREED